MWKYLTSVSFVCCIICIAFVSWGDASEDGSLTILYTGQSHGALLGCNCPSGNPGGLPRRAALINSIKKKHSNVLLVDTGDMLSTYADSVHDHIIFSTVTRMQYDAINIGDQELIYGMGFLNEFNTSLPFISSTLSNPKNGEPLFKTYRLKIVNSIRIAVLGALAVKSFDLFSYDKTTGIGLDAIHKIIPKTIAALKDQADCIVLLSHLGHEKDRALARQIKGIDVIIGGHQGAALSKPVKIGRTIIVHPDESGEHVGLLQLTFDANKKIKYYEGKHIPLDQSVPEDQELLSFIKKISDNSK